MIKRKTAARRVPKMRTGLRGKKGREKPKSVDERVSEKKPIDSSGRDLPSRHSVREASGGNGTHSRSELIRKVESELSGDVGVS